MPTFIAVNEVSCFQAWPKIYDTPRKRIINVDAIIDIDTRESNNITYARISLPKDAVYITMADFVDLHNTLNIIPIN